jgi:hypothetical protein
MNELERLKIIYIIHPCKRNDQASQINCLNIRVNIPLKNRVVRGFAR